MLEWWEREESGEDEGGDQDEFCMCEAADLFLIVNFFSSGSVCVTLSFSFVIMKKGSRLEKYVCDFAKSSLESNAEGLVPLTGPA